MKQSAWVILALFLSSAPSRADELDDARRVLHDALEERAPVPAAPPSFPTSPREPNTAHPPRNNRRSSVATSRARDQAAHQANQVFREARNSAANNAAAKAARDAVKNAQSDVTGAPGQARSQEKRGVGNGKGGGNASSGNNGKGNNGNTGKGQTK